MSSMNGGDTKKAVWARVQASLELLRQGLDEHGATLCGGLRGIVIGISGDLEFFSSWLGFPSSNANHPCPLCPCHKDDMLRWAEDSMWRTSSYKDAAGWRRSRGNRHGALFHGSNALSALSICPDIMHTKFLGSDQYLYVSVIHRLLSPICECSLRVFTSKCERGSLLPAEQSECLYTNKAGARGREPASAAA